MKELTTKQKAKRYDEAMELAKDWYNDNTTSQKEKVLLAAMFSELKEDEQIRKAIIEGLREMKSSFRTISSVKIDDAIAWLEKQGEQNPAWSEEDEAKLKSILFHIEDVENKDVINWLKSLKDRVQPQNHWKPSEEQMKWFRDILDYHGFSSKGQEIMESIYNDLKKLKE